jgi:hypothetical protein
VYQWIRLNALDAFFPRMFLLFVETTNHQYSRTIQEGMWKQQL